MSDRMTVSPSASKKKGLGKINPFFAHNPAKPQIVRGLVCSDSCNASHD